MENKLMKLFSRDVYINYSILSDAMNYTSDEEFDVLYANFESFYHWEPELIRIGKEFRETKKMSDAEFIYTAQAVRDIIDKIDNFVEQIRGSEFPFNFSDIVKKSIRFIDAGILPKVNKDRAELFNDDDPVPLYKSLGMYVKKYDDDVNKRDKNTSKRIIIRLRDKLCHPNSKKYGVIHIMGNYQRFSKNGSESTFDFKGSFSSNIRYVVDKDIFIKAYESLEKSFFDIYKIWNSEISELVLKGVEITPMSTDELTEKFKLYEYDDYFESKFIEKNYDAFKIYKIGELLNDKDIVEFSAILYKLNYIFKESYNYNFWNSEYGDFSLYDQRWEFIKKYHPGSRSSDAYASQKIGQWEDWDAKNWFPTIFSQIDKELPGDESYEWRLMAISSKKLNWVLMREEAERYLEYILSLSPTDVHNMTEEKIRETNKIKRFK